MTCQEESVVSCDSAVGGRNALPVENADVLLVIAQVAVAFAGFASLVSIFGQRDTADDYRAVYWHALWAERDFLILCS